MLKLISILGLVIFFAEHIAAQDLEEELAFSYGGEEFISIATGVKQLVHAAPAVATVITSDQIQKMGVTSLNEVLETVPGLHVSTSSNRFGSTYQIRGIATDFNPHVLMLVNGIPLTHATLGNNGFHPNMPIMSVDRIEVVRGPGSALYGADAFAGVINIITKSPGEYGYEVGGRAGSFNTSEAWFKYGSQLNRFDILLSLEYYKTNGDNDRIITFDAQSFFDMVTGTNVSNAPGPASTDTERAEIRFEMFGEKTKLRLWSSLQRDVGTGPGIAGALDPSGSEDLDNFFIDWSYNIELSEKWVLDIVTSYSDLNIDTDFTLFPEGTILPIGGDGNISPVGMPVLFTDGFIGNPTSDEKHYRVDFASVYSNDKHTTRLATGFTRIEVETTETKNFGPGVIDGTVPVVDGTLTSVTGTSFIYLPNQSRDVYYISIQDEWSIIRDWTFTTGIRYDKYSDFGSTVNPRLALVWATTHNLTTKFLAGKAFRAPAFLELNGINNPVALGNPDLDPETINTFEVAFNYRATANFRAGLNLFYYEIDDLIEYAPDPAGFRAQNSGKRDGTGFEAEFEWKHDKVTFRGHYAFQNSEDSSTNTDIADTPQSSVFLNATWFFNDSLTLGARVNGIFDRARANTDTREKIEDYTTVNMNLRYKINQLTVTASVHNLFDEEIIEPSPLGSLIVNDFPGISRAFFIGLEYNNF